MDLDEADFSMARKPEPKQWAVTMRIERNVTVTVEAVTAEEARDKAEAWDIIGDEQDGDTFNMRITSVTPDE